MAGAAGSVRAFVALEIPGDLRRRIAGLVEDLQPRTPGLRWVAQEALHLTLRFFGDVTPLQLDRLRERIATVAEVSPATRAWVRGLGFFPERGRPRVLWLGLEVAPHVVSLQAACEAAAVAAGLEAEARGFRPHLTLGRWRDPAARPSLPTVDLGETALDTLTLFRSERRPEGARHSCVARFTLARGA
jgi:RNA 2',3'-cyclic 3'-phosphodiesterase